MTKKCSKCGIEKDYCDFNNRKAVKDGKRPECKLCGKLIRDEYLSTEDYKIKKKIYRSIYDKQNSEKIKARRNKWFKKKAETDILFRLSRNVRNRIHKCIKKEKVLTETLVGIDYEGLRNYLESKFSDGMNWENYGRWHIDHIIPLSSAKCEDEIYELCHYSNLQPLWAIENIKKGKKIIW